MFLRVERQDPDLSPQPMQKGQLLRIPVAHGEGNFVADADTLKAIEDNGQVLFRYCDAWGQVGEASNINGAVNSIAGIVSRSGNVFGMMPHPENHVDPEIGSIDGRGLFEGITAALKHHA